MYIIFENSIAVAYFDTQKEAVSYWRQYGGIIVLYPDLRECDVFIINK